MATKFGWIVCIALCWLIHENHAVVRQVIYNEDELIGSCTKTCSTLPDRTNKFGCDRISHCRTSRTGWTRGFVRCDWCRCLCTVTHTMTPPVLYTQSNIIKTEPDLYSTCTGECPHSGLVSTGKFGCDEVRDCRYHRRGWIRGFVRCDYCECTCRVRNPPTNYRVENIRYNLNGITMDKMEQVVLGSDTFTNNEDFASTYTTELEISYESTKRWDTSTTTSWSIEVGVSVSFPIKIVNFEAHTVVTTGRDETYSWGESVTETIHKTVSVSAEVPPHEDLNVRVTGWRFRGRVPYTADHVIVYKDGQERRQRVSGYLNEVSVFGFESSTGTMVVE